MVHVSLPTLALLMISAGALAQDGGLDAGLMIDAGDREDAGLDDAGDGEDDAGDGEDDAGDGGDDGGDGGDAPDGDDAGLDMDDDAGTDFPEDGGVVAEDMDAGTTGDCAIQCVDNVLRYCDAVSGEPLEIDCDNLEARCGLLSEGWGLDCLLPLDAPCASGYAAGLSRCDPASPSGPLYCNMNTCQNTSGDDVLPQIPSDTGGLGDTVEENPHPLACLGCSNDNNPLPFSLSALFILLGMRQLTPRARRRRSAIREAR